MASASDPFLIDTPIVPFLEKSGKAPPLFKALWDYWKQMPSDDGKRPYASFDPIEMREFLPHLFLTQVQPDPLDFRFKVVGTHIEERMGATYTGTWLSDWGHTSKESGIWRTMAAVVSSGKPVLAHYSYIGPIAQIPMTQNLYLPLVGSDGLVSDVLIAVHFENDVTVVLEDTRWSAA